MPNAERLRKLGQIRGPIVDVLLVAKQTWLGIILSLDSGKDQWLSAVI